MLQLHQDNMLKDEVVSFGQEAQTIKRSTTNLDNNNMPQNPVGPKQAMSPNRPNVEAPNHLVQKHYQQSNFLQQIVQEWDQGLRLFRPDA